jgi:hypothetical protein
VTQANPKPLPKPTRVAQEITLETTSQERKRERDREREREAVEGRQGSTRGTGTAIAILLHFLLTVCSGCLSQARSLALSSLSYLARHRQSCRPSRLHRAPRRKQWPLKWRPGHNAQPQPQSPPCRPRAPAVATARVCAPSVASGRFQPPPSLRRA